MYHYGVADLEMKPLGTFETAEEALEVAQRVSIEQDGIFAVLPENDPANPEALAWGGSVYKS